MFEINGKPVKESKLGRDDAARLDWLSDGEVKPLTREQAVEKLTAAESEIRALGVARLALFGSVLRSEARPDSDVDLLVEFSRGAKTYRHFWELSELRPASS